MKVQLGNLALISVYLAGFWMVQVGHDFHQGRSSCPFACGPSGVWGVECHDTGCAKQDHHHHRAAHDPHQCPTCQAWHQFGIIRPVPQTLPSHDQYLVVCQVPSGWASRLLAELPALRAPPITLPS